MVRAAGSTKRFAALAQGQQKIVQVPVGSHRDQGVVGFKLDGVGQIADVDDGVGYTYIGTGVQAAQDTQAARLEKTLLDPGNEAFELIQILRPEIQLRLEGDKARPILKTGLMSLIFH